jgi:hypothetical protein
MLSCARATRGLRRPSLDTRSGRSSSPPSREKVEERWSLDARGGAYASPIAEKNIREQMFNGRNRGLNQATLERKHEVAWKDPT